MSVRQRDAEGNEVEEETEVFLSVKATPITQESSSLGAGIIAAIVAIGCFILLAILLLIYAWRSGKYCFRQVEYVEYEAAKPPQDNADIQTEPVGVSDSGVAAAFGPAKPSRAWVEPDGLQGEGRPLLNGEQVRNQAIVIMQKKWQLLK